MFKITTIHKKFVLIAAFTLSATISHGMITEMRELYSANQGPDQKGQTLILMGDRHGMSNSVSNKQNAVVVTAMAKLNGILITEVPSDTPTVPEISMFNLAWRAEQQGIPLIKPEFRYAHALCAGFMMRKIAQTDNFNEIIAALKEPQSARTLGKNFDESHNQNCTQFDALSGYAQGMRQLSEDTNVTQGFMEGFDTILIPADNALNIAARTINPHTKYSSLANSIVDELFLRNSDNTYRLNTESLWHITEKTTDRLFDATLLQSLHEQRHKRVIFLHAGTEHTQSLATLLPKAGFTEETVFSGDPALVGATRAEIMDDMQSLSAKSAQSAVDAEAFFAQCKTLPRE